MSTEVPGSSPEQTTAPAPAPAPEAGSPSKDERTWAMFAHLSAIFFGFVGPLVIWLIKKDEMPFVSDQGKEALNFTLSLFIAAIGVMIAGTILGAIAGLLHLGFLVSIILSLAWLAVGVYALVQVITAAMKANEGIAFRYPFSLKLVK